jgi:uncharacterized protein (DUF1810 family)
MIIVDAWFQYQSSSRQIGAPSVTDADLMRFVNAQSQIYSRVTEELTEGRKRTHWMWFVFPQLAGLGHSSMARQYAIHDLNQARNTWAILCLGADCVTHSA